MEKADAPLPARLPAWLVGSASNAQMEGLMGIRSKRKSCKCFHLFPNFNCVHVSGCLSIITRGENEPKLSVSANRTISTQSTLVNVDK